MRTLVYIAAFIFAVAFLFLVLNPARSLPYVREKKISINNLHFAIIQVKDFVNGSKMIPERLTDVPQLAFLANEDKLRIYRKGADEILLVASEDFENESITFLAILRNDEGYCHEVVAPTMIKFHELNLDDIAEFRRVVK